MPDILGDGGFYFDPESVDSIASAIEALLLSPDERRRRVDIATRAAERFSWSTCASDTFAFLAEVQRGWRPASA
jgi:glycosyltransferase involved in cell wall biosynthesis